MKSPIILALLGTAISGAGPASGSKVPQPVLGQLRFSPNGRYVLAQDDSAVTVLAMPSLQIVFRVEADPGVLAHFTPDSSGVVLVRGITQMDRIRLRAAHGPGRVEHWSVPDGVRVKQFPLPELAYAKAELAPDGKTLTADIGGEALRVIDIPTGNELLTRRHLMNEQPYARYRNRWNWTDTPLGPVNVRVTFSPDGHFLLAEGNEGILIFDTFDHVVVKLKGEAAKSTRFIPSNVISVASGRMLTGGQTRLPMGGTPDQRIGAFSPNPSSSAGLVGRKRASTLVSRSDRPGIFDLPRRRDG